MGFAVTLIRGYQRYLSPLKGFSCAYRVKHGRASCSEHGKRAIARYGLTRGLMLLWRRLHACTHAAEMLDYERRRSELLTAGTSVWACHG